MNKKKVKKILKDLYPYLVIFIMVVLVRSFIITPAIVDGSSMVPTLDDGNVILLNKLDKRLNDIKRFDIVVVDYNGRKLVKRVIGLPNEYVEYSNNTLYINENIVTENFKHTDTSDFTLESIGYVKIPGNKYLVVGDNRNNSIDSRTIGLIEEKNILGTVSIRLFPFNKLGKVK